MRFALKQNAIHFARDRKGGIAIVFALSLVVLVAVAGLAVDYARATSTTQALQADLDSTVLFVARSSLNAPPGSFNAEQSARDYFKGLHRTVHGAGPAKLKITQTGPGKFSARATLDVATTLSRVLGVKSSPVTVSSDVAVGDRPIEVALVLDNTGSMAGPKLDALKTASKSLIDTVYQAERADKNVRISLVPFAQYVNVGLPHRNESWMSVDPDTSTTQPDVCYQDTPVIGKSNCVTNTATAYNDGVPYTYTYETCDYQYGPPTQVCYTPTTTNTWYGCAGSRNYPLETLDQDYETPIPGIMNVSCPSTISPLTNDRTALEQQIDAMIATGETYIPSGLVWGWRTLSKEAPFEEALGYGETVNGETARKFMVLMTDGKNTLSPSYPSHTGTDTALADKITLELCQNIKAKGIEVYTVAFDVPDAGAKQVLQECASASNKFFDAADGTELDDAFRRIAQDFTPLRLTR